MNDLGLERTGLLYYSEVPTRLNTPEITIHCANELCDGMRLFKTHAEGSLIVGVYHKIFIEYICKNCSETTKTYALRLHLPSNGINGTAYKYGELPSFCPPTPARLITLIGPARELFLKGRAAENQGMGIASFAYYRRVIEGQKDRIFDEVVKVCKRLSTDDSIVSELIAAKAETQFTKAVDLLKRGIPQALFINGHNPLTLLHGALSEGLHAEDDETCLELAGVIRTVMAAFSERMAQTLKDEVELNAAVTRLLQRKLKPKTSDVTVVTTESS